MSYCEYFPAEIPTKHNQYFYHCSFDITFIILHSLCFKVMTPAQGSI